MVPSGQSRSMSCYSSSTVRDQKGGTRWRGAIQEIPMEKEKTEMPVVLLPYITWQMREPGNGRNEALVWLPEQINHSEKAMGLAAALRVRSGL